MFLLAYLMIGMLYFSLMFFILSQVGNSLSSIIEILLILLFSFKFVVFYYFFSTTTDYRSCQLADWYFNPKYKSVFQNLPSEDLKIIQKEILGIRKGFYVSIDDFVPRAISSPEHAGERSTLLNIHCEIEKGVKEIDRSKSNN